MKVILSVFFFACLTTVLTATAGEDYVCDNNGAKRIVSIVYQNEEQPVPCEVRYDKGQGVETLWTAKSEVGFCEARVNEFIEKQESWGWNCNRFEVPETVENVDSQQSQNVSDLESPEVAEDGLHTSMY